jgi:tyrosyl-tRNA synthetase
VLRTGKWKVRVVEVVDDEVFESEGLEAPGWAEWKESRRA